MKDIWKLYCLCNFSVELKFIQNKFIFKGHYKEEPGAQGHFGVWHRKLGVPLSHGRRSIRYSETPVAWENLSACRARKAWAGGLARAESLQTSQATATLSLRLQQERRRLRRARGRASVLSQGVRGALTQLAVRQEQMPPGHKPVMPGDSLFLPLQVSEI